LLQIEERVIAAIARDNEERRRQPAFAARETRLESNRAVGIGLFRGKHVVVAREQSDLDMLQRRRGRE
jgi:hypothetical protein